MEKQHPYPCLALGYASSAEMWDDPEQEA